MRFIFIPALLALSFCGQISASNSLKTIKAAEQLRDQSLAENEGFRLVTSLTTEIGARPAGSAQDAAAVAWAQRQFKALGYDRVWLQAVQFPHWQRGYERATLISDTEQSVVVTALGGSVGTRGGVIEAPLVEFASLADLRNAAEGSLVGKIAYISHRMDRHRDGRGYGPVVAGRSNGAIEAARKGAEAIIIRSVGTDSDRFAHTGTMRYDENVRKIPAAAVSNPDADQISRLIAMGKTPVLRLELAVGTTGVATSYNVIGEITGSQRPDEIVVIGGHLDSWDLGTGAIDDGAGVAITMAAGAQILKMKKRPARTIRVIAFANEEQGLWGGKTYAADSAFDVNKHIIGAESDFGAGRIYAIRSSAGAQAEEKLTAIAQVLSSLQVEWQSSGGGGGPDLSPLVSAGMPWAQLAQDGSDYFDYHHTANDTLDKIDPAAMDQQVAAYAVFAYMIANSDMTFGTTP